MKISAAKTKFKMKPFFVGKGYKLFVQHSDGKILSFIVELKDKTKKEFKVKSSKTKVDMLGPFKKMERFVETLK